MLRQLLTLLAVFGGLTAAVEPAQAMAGSVQAVQLSESAAPCQVQPAPALVRLADTRQEPARRARPCLRRVLELTPPTVILQADRAHE